MNAPDPDDAPTRHGKADPAPESKPSPSPIGDQTRPAQDRVPPPDEDRTSVAPAASTQRKASPPPPRPAPAPSPAAAGGGDPLLGKVLGGCRLEKLLGRGAMGAVYKARQEKLDRDVAVKVIRPEMMTDARMLKRFEVEARTVGKFNSAHVVMVHDVGFDLGVHYLVMEFVQGKNLRDHVKLLAGGRLPVGEALPLLRQAIKGLEEAQRLHVIHRDIKPDNLMLTDRGSLKIADFGIAKPLQDDFSMTLTSELVGTPLYMSPEQCQGQAELDFRSDMYSLGATFYYLLTGEPPIRASSVYELIQTKTKLAHLCLWKALPGLDENNPLSRVIERMTALAREDRYDSYEELLNDLVLVEHGQTVQTGGVPGVGGRRKAAASRRGAVLGALAVLLLGGGGAAYYLTRPKPAVVEPAARAGEQLAAMRTRLRQEGPSETLWAELGRLGVPDDLAAERAALVAETEAARALRQALEQVGRPKALALPFADLRSHLEAVGAAVAANAVRGADAETWRDAAVAAARDEQALGNLALAELATAWAKWGDDRARAGGDAKAIGELEQRLRGLEEARSTLVTLLPTFAGTVSERLPEDRLQAARRDLASAPTGPVDVDLGPALGECRAQLASEGPTQQLFDRIDKLKPSRTEQTEARGTLLNDFERARRASSEASGVRTNKKPQPPKLPFDDVAEYWRAIDRAFDPVRAGDGSLPAWAAAMRQELRGEAELRQQVLAACGEAFAGWEKQAPGSAPATELVALRAARSRARELFTDAVAAIDAAIPEARLAAGETAAARVGKVQRWLADAEKTARQLAAVTTFADWATAQQALGEQAAALQAAAAELAGDTDVARELKRVADGLERWRLAATRMRDVDTRLANGEVRAAEVPAKAGAAGGEGRAEFALAVETVAAVDSAFANLARTLSIDAAEAALGTAREKLRTMPCLAGAEQRLVRWLEALQALRTATVGMVPIGAGRAKGGAAVDAFFIAATECSRAEFAQFVGELRAALAGKEPGQYLATLGNRVAGSGITVGLLERLLERSDKADKMPIESITWFSAAACAAWQRRALPTADEWALAAFGDAGAQAFPWGGTWSNESAQRNPGTTAVEVDSGGLSWRTAAGGKLHHLAGNVAEWLAGDPAQPDAKLAGGRYNDTSLAVSRERAGGSLESAAKDDGRRGYGFRTVVRVRGFPGLDWPR